MKRKNHHTAGAAIFAVASELSRRGYDVTFTIGNTPRVDLLCSVPDGPTFKIQVKGISQDKPFRVQKKFFDISSANAPYLVVVRVPREEETIKLKFFILSHEEAKKGFDKIPRTKKDGTPYNDSDLGLGWDSIKPYKNKWGTLPKLA